MYKINQNAQMSLYDFNQPIGLKMNPENRWIKKAEAIPWDAIEERYGKAMQLSKRAYPAICERSYDLRADSIIECLGLKDFDYNRVSSYGHIGKSDYLRRSKESI